jgi:hypothetical protein
MKEVSNYFFGAYIFCNQIYMSSEVLFCEKQKFTQWWLWLILLSVNSLLLYAVFKQVISGHPIGDRAVSNYALIVIVAFTVLLTILFLRFTLLTQIRKDGIYVKFFPFHLSFRKYGWEEISKAFVRKYNPITEYGGWGIRFGVIGKGKAFNVSGNEGLQLEFYNKKKLLIGTKKPTELAETLRRIRQYKE